MHLAGGIVKYVQWLLLNAIHIMIPILRTCSSAYNADCSQNMQKRCPHTRSRAPRHAQHTSKRADIKHALMPYC